MTNKETLKNIIDFNEMELMKIVLKFEVSERTTMGDANVQARRMKGKIEEELKILREIKKEFEKGKYKI